MESLLNLFVIINDFLQNCRVIWQKYSRITDLKVIDTVENVPLPRSQYHSSPKDAPE